MSQIALLQKSLHEDSEEKQNGNSSLNFMDLKLLQTQDNISCIMQ